MHEFNGTMAGHRSHYYRNLFPIETVFAFVSLHSRKNPENNELALEFSDEAPSKFWRNKYCVCASDIAELLRTRHLHALHLGPCFNMCAQRAKGNSRASKIGKPWFIDLDLQDFPIVNTPKEDMAANDRWVPIVFGAAKTLKEAIRFICGYEHFVCVYSGRRGCHLWILDEAAFFVPQDVRAAIIKMLSARVDKSDTKLLVIDDLCAHPSTKSAITVAHKVWNDTIMKNRNEGGCGLLDSPNDIKLFIKKLFDTPKAETSVDYFHDQLRTDIETKLLSSRTTGQGAFKLICKRVESNTYMAYRLQQIKFSYVWPRIDVNASSDLSHLSKVPFSIHAKTDRISIPIDIDLPNGDCPQVPKVTGKLLMNSDKRATMLLNQSADLFKHVIARATPVSDALMTDIEDLVPMEKRKKL